MTELKQLVDVVKSDIMEHFVPRVKEGCKLALRAFIETLWDYLKEEVLDSARKSLTLIKTLWESAEVKEKKAAIIEVIMLRIKLPLVAKPFNGLIKKIIGEKIDDIVEMLLGKGFKALG